MKYLLVGLVCLAACGGSGTPSQKSPDGGVAFDRGPTTTEISADPNGLWWDDATSTLYIADDDNDRILSWTDGAGTTLAASLPATSQSSPGLGQLVKLSDGTLVVTRFGGGTAGDVAFLKADGTSGVVPGLDPTRRRIGLGVDSTGALYDSFFEKLNSEQVGAIARLSLDGTEQDLATTFEKPIGVVAVGGTLYVSDQGTGQIYSAPTSNPSKLTAFAQMIDGVDLLSAGPDGSLFSGGASGVVYRIASDGSFTVFASGFDSTRGVAYDPTHKRLFVAEHNAQPIDDIHHFHILPVD